MLRRCCCGCVGPCDSLIRVSMTRAQLEGTPYGKEIIRRLKIQMIPRADADSADARKERDHYLFADHLGAMPPSAACFCFASRLCIGRFSISASLAGTPSRSCGDLQKSRTDDRISLLHAYRTGQRSSRFDSCRASMNSRVRSRLADLV